MSGGGLGGGVGSGGGGGGGGQVAPGQVAYLTTSAVPGASQQQHLTIRHVQQVRQVQGWECE